LHTALPKLHHRLLFLLGRRERVGRKKTTTEKKKISLARISQLADSPMKYPLPHEIYSVYACGERKPLALLLLHELFAPNTHMERKKHHDNFEEGNGSQSLWCLSSSYCGLWGAPWV
jgi:hypothetical protein